MAFHRDRRRASDELRSGSRHRIVSSSAKRSAGIVGPIRDRTVRAQMASSFEDADGGCTNNAAIRFRSRQGAVRCGDAGVRQGKIR
jgi:hypothetical protein